MAEQTEEAFDWTDREGAIIRLRQGAPVVKFDLPYFRPRPHHLPERASEEMHQADRTYPVQVFIAPDLDAFGRHYVDYGYSFEGHVIALKEWNEQVLLHEILHAILGSLVPREPVNGWGFLYEHNVVNSIEVALAPLIQLRLEGLADV